MKDKVLFGLFVLLAFSAGFTLGGVGGSDDTASDIADSVADTTSQQQATVDDLKYIDELESELAAVREELVIANNELGAISASGETVSVLKERVVQQQSEIGSLQAAWQNAVADSASWQLKYNQSLANTADAQRLLMNYQEYYNDLYGKLAVVDSRSSTTVNSFTDSEISTFYTVWDEWWELVIEGTD